MAKKKDKPQVINNIQELNLEIDYDKLAEAIVKAQNKASEISDETEETELGFWKSVWYIIRNKNKKSGSVLAESMSMLLSLVFNILAILFFVGGVLTAVMLLVYIFSRTEWELKIVFNAITFAVSGIFLEFFALLMRGIANDISWEQNRNYIVSIFSSMVSFAALIVALVALFKGVG